MVQLTPKQLEIRQREDCVLTAAVQMIRHTGGLASLSMEAIAKQIGYTRGTIYNHFQNKEEIVISLATRAVQRRMELFQLATKLGSISREKVAAVGIACEVYADHLPDDFLFEQLTRHVWDKTSEARREVLTGCEAACMKLMRGLIEEALSDGDFVLPSGRSSSDVVLGLWSLVYGGLLLEATSPSLAETGVSDARAAIRRNCNAMLDGLGWNPTFDEAAYQDFVDSVSAPLIERAQELADSVRTNFANSQTAAVSE